MYYLAGEVVREEMIHNTSPGDPDVMRTGDSNGVRDGVG
jgi:hypothetical protein